MGGIKTRGKDKKKRKSRGKAVLTGEPEKKPGIISTMIKDIAEKLKHETEEPWSLDIGPRVTSLAPSTMPARHVFKREREGVVEIDLSKL